MFDCDGGGTLEPLGTVQEIEPGVAAFVGPEAFHGSEGNNVSAMKSKHLFGARIILACKLGVDALGDVVDLVPRRIVDQPMDLMLDIARRTIIGIGSLEQRQARSEEQPSELQSLMRISYTVLVLKTKQ